MSGNGVLFIGPEEKVKIHAAIKRARANFLPWDLIKDHVLNDPRATLTLKERDPKFVRPQSEHIMLGTYRAAISFEEQPAGMMRHLSVSSQAKNKIPGPEVMEMVCEEFGFSKVLCKSFVAFAHGDETPIQALARIWLEEFDPGHMAINILELENSPLLS